VVYTVAVGFVMAGREIQYCRDRAYMTRHISLPRIFSLNAEVDGRVEYARTDQLQDMRHMIELAEKRGN